MKLFFFSALSFFLLIFTGCTPRNAMIKVDTYIAHGSYIDAARYSDSQIDKRDKYARNNLLWELQSGSAYLYAKENNISTEHFNTCESLIKHYQEQTLVSDLSQGVTSTLLNDTTRPYMGTQYDAIMANTYKAINYMAIGDRIGARVEFNRAIDRQRRAKIYFAQMIHKEQREIAKKEQKSQKDGKNLRVEDSKIDAIIHNNYPELYNFKPYPDFINPMTTYLAGIFARADGDESKAYSLLREAYGMMPDNNTVLADLQNKTSQPTVWLIYENGQAPLLHELRMDFPLWIFTNHLSYISVALPHMIRRSLAYNYLTIESDDSTFRTKFLASMDRVIETEFKKTYPSIVRRAILSTATKAAINYAVQESANNSNSNAALLLSIASAIYQISSTQADTRIWSTLPKEFQLARFKQPKNGIVTLKTPNNLTIQKIDLPKSDNILIYVKIATIGAKASVSVIPF